MSSQPDETEAKEKQVVLVVEDEETNRDLFKRMLEEEGGFEVIIEGAAESAQKHLLNIEFAVDACLLDIMLPGASGEDLLTWIKKKAPQMPVIMITGYRQDERVLHCLRNGAVDFLEKPVRASDLVRVIKSGITRQQHCNEAPGDIQADHFSSDWVELTAPSEMEYLGRLQRFTEVLLLSRLPRDVREDLRLTIEEVGRNAIEWGNKFDRNKQFRISYCAFPDRIVFKFEDEGEGFIPKSLPDPTKDPKEHILNRKKQGKRPGGFGVFLVQKLMDEVVYSEKGNVVIMSKYIPTHEESTKE